MGSATHGKLKNIKNQCTISPTGLPTSPHPQQGPLPETAAWTGQVGGAQQPLWMELNFFLLPVCLKVTGIIFRPVLCSRTRSWLHCCWLSGSTKDNIAATEWTCVD